MDTSYIIYGYIIMIGIMTIIYLKLDRKDTLKDIVAILSGTTIALGLLNYVTIAKEKEKQEELQSKKLYIENISSLFVKINSEYIDHPEELNDLFYEFYGYNNFPLNKSKNNNISSFEFMVINVIIEHLNNMYIINPSIFKDLNIRNRLLCFTNSRKFKRVLSHLKNNYSFDFISSLIKEGIIRKDEIDLESVSIPRV